MQYETNKLIIGLTGGIGSGKSIVSDLFADLRIEIIDADIISRELVMPGEEIYNMIVTRLSSTILNQDKTLNRQIMREKVFSNPELKLWLENLLHPKIRDKMHTLAKASVSPYVILVIPLLIETLPNPILNRVLLITASEKIKIERIVKRDHCSIDMAKKIINSQVDDDIRKQHADDVIINNTGIDILKKQVIAMHQQYLLKSQTN